MNSDTGSLDRTGTLWAPYLEWSLPNSSYSGNPFDLEAWVTFTHKATGQQHKTQMFYAGSNTWKFRFTGTRTGEWNFTTSSSDSDLNGKSGKVVIGPNPDSNARGFITNFGNKWGWQGTEEAFVPQLAMLGTNIGVVLADYHNNPAAVDQAIQEYIHGHGFTGFHTGVIGGQWFGIGNTNARVSSSMTNPDPRSFEALELLITRVHQAGGMVHIWAWGDHDRRMTPQSLSGGINGAHDQRLQRYIAARLGPIPGWTIGYGFDNWEWSTGSQHAEWHSYMHKHFGWPHFLGVRWEKNKLTQSTGVLDYSGYEIQVSKTYQDYVSQIDARPNKPTMSEDRFRTGLTSSNAGSNAFKNYTEEEMRRGLWHSTMAGGVANIWGNLTGSELRSVPYSTAAKQQIKTYSTFFFERKRFMADMVRANNLSSNSNALVLRSGNSNLIIYRENVSSIQLDLRGLVGLLPAVAVDTRKAYAEVDLGILNALSQTVSLPYSSDWAIAVGRFGGSSGDSQLNEPKPDDTPPTAPQGLQASAVSETRIGLTWNAASDPESGVAHYNIYRDGKKVAQSSATSYSDTGLSKGASYSYRVSAVNGVGLEGAKSSAVTGTTLANTTPPTIQSARMGGTPSQVVVVYSKPVGEASATKTENYAINNGISVQAASLAGDLKTVTLTTTEHALGTTYTLTGNNVKDREQTPNTIDANTQVTYTFTSQLILSDLTASSGKAYKFVDEGLASGASVYIDRNFTFNNVPEIVSGVPYIQTANEDKAADDTNFLSFHVNQGVTVYVAYDIRATSLPAWLDSWTDTGEVLGTNDTDRRIYSREFPAGTVSLGGNLAPEASGANSNYSVAVFGGAEIAEPPSNDQEQPTQPPPSQPQPNQPPQAAIGSPADGETFTAGSPIAFSGSANDPEDGGLTGSALVWASSRDGQIGTGQSLTTTLSTGSHTITLTATDSAGASASVSVSITVNSGQAALALGSASGLPGQSVTLPITLDTQGTPVRSLQVNMTYDEARLTQAAGERGAVLSGDWEVSWHSPQEGDLRLIAMALDSGQTINGVAFTVTFTVAANAPQGDVPVVVALQEVRDTDNGLLDVTTSNGSIAVAGSVVFGDAIGDGAFTSSDVNEVIDWIIARKPMPQPGSSRFISADVNGDGVVNAADINLMVDRLLGMINKFPVES